MAFEKHSNSTAEAEVTQVSADGFRLVINNEELFLTFDQFPWFKEATFSAISNVKLISDRHVFWPRLDVDLSIEMLKHPERYPLTAK